ncbi:unknown, partial [Harrisina brillians granulovirus]
LETEIDNVTLTIDETIEFFESVYNQIICVNYKNVEMVCNKNTQYVDKSKSENVLEIPKKHFEDYIIKIGEPENNESNA